MRYADDAVRRAVKGAVGALQCKPHAPIPATTAAAMTQRD
eukprot:gene18639-40084_t